MPIILTFPTHRRGADRTIVVNDVGETPLFADDCEALALAHAARIARATPLTIDEADVARLTSPRKYGPLMRFEAARRESQAAYSQKGQR